MSNIQTNILADVMDSTRDLVFFYSRNVPKEKWSQTFEMEGKKLNSISWELCHLAWAQNFLILKATNGPAMEKEWFNQYGIGKQAAIEFPESHEILGTLNKVHELSLKHVRSMKDEELNEPNLIGMKFRMGETKKAIITHHIRHEGTHIGQLAWLAKLHGVKTI